MIRMAALLVCLLFGCTACTALPAEERAFAVVLHVGREGETWQVHARIPTYQSAGEYRTVSGRGATLPSALADMDEKAPMHLHLSQLRLLVLDESLVQGGDAMAVLCGLCDRADIRYACHVAVSQVPAGALMEAFRPEAGKRLSKAIDVQLDTHMEQGRILSATLGEVISMGSRQSPVLIRLTLDGGVPLMSGGTALPADGSSCTEITAEETMLLSLLRDGVKRRTLLMAGEAVQILHGSARVDLSADLGSARVTLRVQTGASPMAAKALAERMADDCVQLLSRLSARGCDVLGLGRSAVMQADSMAQWQGMNWPERCRQIVWTVQAGADGAAT